MPDQLPEGWVKTTLGEVCARVATIQPEDAPDTEFTYFDIGGIDNQSNRIVETKTFVGREAPSRARQAVRNDDILFSTVRTYLKKIARIEQDYPNPVASTGFTVVRAAEGVSPQFLFLQVLSEDFLQPLHALLTGSSYPAVRDKDVFAQPIRLAPTREQERIVAKLDALLSRVAAGEAAARRALERLKRYRAAVLHAAVTGELTRDWRERRNAASGDAAYKTAYPDAVGRLPSAGETGAQLLQRLLHERRARWEAAELKRLHAAGKPSNDEKWKMKYEEPAPAKMEGLPDIPDGWTWASLGQLLSLVRNGIGLPPNEQSGLPALRISAVRPLSVDLNERRYFPESRRKEYAEFALDEGDLLFTRYDGSKDLAGVCGRVPALNETIVHPDKLIRCVPISGFVPIDRFVEIAANSGVSRKVIADSLRTTAGQWGLSGSVLKEIPIPLPCAAEQTEIVREVERRLAAADQLAASLQRQLDRARALRQSLLREAFAGHLVPQDPREESASVLLERLRAARATATSIPRSSRGHEAQTSRNEASSRRLPRTGVVPA